MSRLNFLQILLCLVLGRPWIFYYFTPLATVWFGCIYTTLYLYSSKNNSVPFVLFKIFLLIICIEIIFSDMNGATKQNFIYQYIFMNRFTGSLFELSQDHGHFFQSRMAMDRYSVPAGMIFAVLLQKYRLLNKKSTSPSNTSDEAEGGTSIQTVSAFKEENKYWNVLVSKYTKRKRRTRPDFFFFIITSLLNVIKYIIHKNISFYFSNFFLAYSLSK